MGKSLFYRSAVRGRNQNVESQVGVAQKPVCGVHREAGKAIAGKSDPLKRERMDSHPPASDQLSAGFSAVTPDLPFFNGTKPVGIPSTRVLPALCAAERDCMRRRFIR